MLVYIEGGPAIFANQVFQAAVGGKDDILEHPEYIAHQDEYRWTPRTIRSTKNPDLVAQVWQHKSVPEDASASGMSPIPTAAEDNHSLASQETTREVDTEAAQAVSSPLPAGVESPTSESSVLQHIQEGEEQIASGAPFVTLDAAMQADYTGEPVEISEEDNGDLPSGEELFLQRKRLKLTVQEVADAVGLKRSRVDAIEKGTAVRGNVSADQQKVYDHLRELTEKQLDRGDAEPPRE